METIWKKIPIFQGQYYASNNGKIKVIDFNDCAGKLRNGRLISMSVNNRGRERTTIRGKNYSIHTLVFMAFKGEILKGNEINHIDGNPLNNNIDNLEQCTHAENMKHSWENGLHSGDMVAKSVTITMDNNDIIFKSSKKLSEFLKRSPQTICDYLNGRMKGNKLNIRYT